MTSPSDPTYDDDLPAATAPHPDGAGSHAARHRSVPRSRSSSAPALRRLALTATFGVAASVLGVYIGLSAPSASPATPPPVAPRPTSAATGHG